MSASINVPDTSAPAENVLTPSRITARHADAWLGDVLVDALTAGLPAW